MKSLLRLAITVAIFALIASNSHAGTSELLMQMGRSFNGAVNEGIIPFQAKDAFRGVPECGILDAKTIRQYTLREAVELLAPCLKDVSARYGVALSARPGIVGLSVEAQGGLPGIVIETGPVSIISPIMRDLGHALSRRDGRIFGHPTKVERRGEIGTLSQSAVQESLDRCMLPTMVRRITSSADFVKLYGGCIRKDKSLKILDLRPWEGDGFTITLQSAASKEVVESLNGNVTVNPGSGPVNVLVIAYPETIYLP